MVVAALVGTGRVVSVFWLHDTNREANTADAASVTIKVFLIVYLFVGRLKQGDYIQRLRILILIDTNPIVIHANL